MVKEYGGRSPRPNGHQPRGESNEYSANCSGAEKDGAEEGKTVSPSAKILALSPNANMVNAIKSEQSHLKNIVIFFVCMDMKFLPARKFLDDWIGNIWGKKLGINVSFSRIVQKGLFVIFFKNHAV